MSFQAGGPLEASNPTDVRDVAKTVLVKLNEEPDKEATFSTILDDFGSQVPDDVVRVACQGLILHPAPRVSYDGTIICLENPDSTCETRRLLRRGRIRLLQVVNTNNSPPTF